MVTVVDRDTEAPRRSRRRRGVGTIPLVLLVVLAGLVVAADRVGASMAESRLVSVVESELADQKITASSTDVTVTGFPFLTQVLSGHYDRITIDIDGLRSGKLKVKNLHVDADDVAADAGDILSGSPKATAARLTGVATIAWDELPGLLDYAGFDFADATFTAAGEGVHVTGLATIGEQTVPVTATAAFSVVKNQIRVKISQASVSGMELPQEAKDYVNQLQDDLSVGFTVPPLPFGLSVRKVAATDDGLAVTATATDVALAQ